MIEPNIRPRGESCNTCSSAMTYIAELRRQWDADPHASHNRPPFRAHQFDAGDVAVGRWFVVGSTMVNCLGSLVRPLGEDAHSIAACLNGAA